jgi:hypothetical protein
MRHPYYRRLPRRNHNGGDMARNHLGERTFETYEGWRKACKKVNPSVRFEGDRDICQALPGVGEWDGVSGCIYSSADKGESDATQNNA